MAGAPLGNRNGCKKTEWYEALRYALKSFENKEVSRGRALRYIALRVVSDALKGDKDCWQEIGNRLDGKSVQATVITGDDGAINVIHRIVIDDKQAEIKRVEGPVLKLNPPAFLSDTTEGE